MDWKFLVGTASGVLVTLATAFLAQHIGWIQISIAKEAHQLNVLKSFPKIGTHVRIDKRDQLGTNYPPWYYLIVTIYNEGELAAKKINGECKLFSPVKDIQEQSIPIERDFLGAAVYQLEPCRIVGVFVDAAFRAGEKEIAVNADIDFRYLSATDEQQPQHYSAKYCYDNKSRQMRRCDSNSSSNPVTAG